MLQISPTLAARFWAKVQKADGDGCWLWTGAQSTKHPYGTFWAGDAYRAPHVVAWILTNGAVPTGCVVCHRCDNPPCVRPSHLVAATPGANLRDAYAKNRRPRKLTSDDLVQIRQQLISGDSISTVARDFSVSRKAIRCVRSGGIQESVCV